MNFLDMKNGFHDFSLRAIDSSHQNTLINVVFYDIEKIFEKKIFWENSSKLWFLFIHPVLTLRFKKINGFIFYKGFS